MERVSGDSAAIASSTNSCGTVLRRLTAKRVSSSGSNGVLRWGVDIGLRIPGFHAARFQFPDREIRRCREAARRRSRLRAGWLPVKAHAHTVKTLAAMGPPMFRRLL